MAKKRIKKTECPNCGSKLSADDNFCPNCGQENHTHKLPVRHFLMATLENVFHFDTKVIASIRELFIPGRMTANYNQNKRARYVQPVRFYIFVSFIFFLLLTLRSGLKHEENNDDEGIVLEPGNTSIDTTDAYAYLLEQIKASPHPDSLIDAYLTLRYGKMNWLERRIQRNQVIFQTGHLGKQEMRHKIYKVISYSLFFLMPVMSLYLMLLYRRKKLYYSEHLIFALHFHSLLFILFSIWLLLNLLHINIPYLLPAIILLYLFLSLRNVYAQGWLKTSVKFFLLGTVYSVTICLVLVLSFILSIIV